MRVVAETITVLSEGAAVDLLVWRKFRRPMPGYVEQVLNENPNLANIIEPVPVGTKIFFPAVDLDGADQKNALIPLWS